MAQTENSWMGEEWPHRPLPLFAWSFGLERTGQVLLTFQCLVNVGNHDAHREGYKASVCALWISWLKCCKLITFLNATRRKGRQRDGELPVKLLNKKRQMSLLANIVNTPFILANITRQITINFLNETKCVIDRCV